MTESNVLKPGKEIRIIFLDGKYLVCKVQAVDRYNLYVKHVESDKNFIVFKHAIRYIDLGVKS